MNFNFPDISVPISLFILTIGLVLMGCGIGWAFGISLVLLAIGYIIKNIVKFFETLG